MPWRNLWTILLPRCNIWMNSFDNSMYSQNLWCGLISLKDILIFLKSDMIEKQDIKNFSSWRSKSYASVVLCDFEVAFLGEWDDTHFCTFFYCVLLYRVLHNQRGMSSNFLSSIYQRYFVKACNFSIFNFFQYGIKFSFINCPSLMSS